MSTKSLFQTLNLNLNPSQLAAVTSPASQLAILAGPGSGKTHTLTSRVAWLLKHEGLAPPNVIVATFTVKAAKEMEERIGRLLGDGNTSGDNKEKGDRRKKIVIGTFHSIARRYLVRYGELIGIPKGFGIADSGDSLGILRRIIKRLGFSIEPAAARSRISRKKAGTGQLDGEHEKKKNYSASKSEEAQEFETCYAEYEEALRRSNLLDYDDLLLRCVDLLRQHPACVRNVEAVLIDEFQDTNTVQFDLMRLFATYRKRVTIVGDPDQSIYGFRSAETRNFKRMLQQYPDTVTIPLEENYRSSGSILMAALEVIQQDESRIAKSLMPTHSVGTRPVLRKLISSPIEAQWIVKEIQRSLALTGGLLNQNDIAILLRSANLSRHIESALGKAGISYRMVGGHKFYDRVEVKILLDYLRTIQQPENNDALARVINVPSRKIGEVTVKALLEEADRASVTLWTLILDCVQGRKKTATKLTAQCERGLAAFVNIVLTARKKLEAEDATMTTPSIVELLEYVIKKISFEDYLQKSYPDDFEARWANVQELINLAADFSANLSDTIDDDALPELESEDLPRSSDSDDTPLSKFLANVSLASSTTDIKSDSSSPSEPTPQVTISTIHAAKGLEWPVVFIPSVYDGSIPHSRADDADEERRLLYVAMTRAKALLYLSYPVKNSKRENVGISPFLAEGGLGKKVFAERGPSFVGGEVVSGVARILRRVMNGDMKIDVEGLLATLGSLEDDVFPVEPMRGNGDGENDEDWDEYGDGERREWNDWNGKTHHFTQGQDIPIPISKRRRVERSHSNIVEYDSGNSAYPNRHQTYSTTMSRTATFTTASSTMLQMQTHTGFVTAGSHMRDLGERETMAGDVSANGNRDASTNVNATPEVAKTKPRTARTTKRAEGQGSLLSYFGKSVGGGSADAAATLVRSSKAQSVRHQDDIISNTSGYTRATNRRAHENQPKPQPQFQQQPRQPVQEHGSANTFLQPAFPNPLSTDHRLGSGSLKTSHMERQRAGLDSQDGCGRGDARGFGNEHEFENGPGTGSKSHPRKKAYLQFSSSPPRPVPRVAVVVDSEEEDDDFDEAENEDENQNKNPDLDIGHRSEKEVETQILNPGGLHTAKQIPTPHPQVQARPPPQPHPQFRPATTLHVTSVQRINTLSANTGIQRKTLGVRRSLNSGWSVNKGGKGVGM